MSINDRLGLAAIAVCFIAAGGPSAYAEGAPPLAAHLAIYDLTLGDEQGTSAPADAKGEIAYQFKGSACEGWSLDFRQVLEIQPAGEGPPHLSDLRSTTFESADAQSFRFKTQTSSIGGPPTTVVGSASKTDQHLSVKVTTPETASLDFARKVVFPTEQMGRLVAAAEAGQHTVAMKLFDGSDNGKKLYSTLAVIGAPATAPPKDPAAQSEPLRSMRRWPATVSYFEDGVESAAPEYILSFDLYENGVSGSLRLNYGDFTMNGAMTHFEILPQKTC